MTLPSYVHGASPQALIGQTIGQLFDQTCREHGRREALVVRHQQIRWSYEELREQVDRLACGLIRLGLKPGDRIGIWSQNNAEWVLTQFATAKAGLIMVNINPAYRRSELEYALSKVGRRALILSPSFRAATTWRWRRICCRSWPPASRAGSSPPPCRSWKSSSVWGSSARRACSISPI